ncbi:formyl transferase domain-containing protein [Candidatus Haloredivivus sp. G17]|jgi:methionyl-tRNA formyltransferase|nr:formyl transferase domain-containing protein [Candidatus Haloredivivus sp. G17]
MNLVFLGINEAGEEVLEWLKQKENVDIKAVIEEREGLQKIKDLRPELVVSSGFEHIVPKQIIQIPEKGIINLHPSYLPHNRGAHPYIWPLIEDTPAGVSVHFMNEGIDEGPVIARKKVEKRPDDDAESLRERLMKEQAELFKDNWDRILREEAWEQNLEEGSFHLKSDLDEISNLDLEKEMTLREAINLLKGLTFGDKKLASIDEEYFVGVNIEKE